MAKKIGKKYLKGSKNHQQQTGGRSYFGRGRDIDAIVDSAQTGKNKPKKEKGNG